MSNSNKQKVPRNEYLAEINRLEGIVSARNCLERYLDNKIQKLQADNYALHNIASCKDTEIDKLKHELGEANFLAHKFDQQNSKLHDEIEQLSNSNKEFTVILDSRCGIDDFTNVLLTSGYTVKICGYHEKVKITITKGDKKNG